MLSMLGKCIMLACIKDVRYSGESRATSHTT